ncbi:ribonuclease p protein subunit p20 [Anaeramoeba flamelloides]|uniref:Ribonuclease P protein subunit p20 n=1 Tax=Anaeramoeba flamelloides TaxID=1746091 RepID=A0AAV7ZZB0_9EUKA|nr:ribonuclease p protein subunit p20 [Anaeramoeba flamelloides]
MDNYEFVKGFPNHLSPKRNDIYVSSKRSVKSLLKRADKLLIEETKVKQINVFALGNAINKAIDFALDLQEKYCHQLKLTTSTSTVELFDEYQPKTEDQEPITQKRHNSAIHIKITRKYNFQIPQNQQTNTSPHTRK